MAGYFFKPITNRLTKRGTSGEYMVGWSAPRAESTCKWPILQVCFGKSFWDTWWVRSKGAINIIIYNSFLHNIYILVFPSNIFVVFIIFIVFQHNKIMLLNIVFPHNNIVFPHHNIMFLTIIIVFSHNNIVFRTILLCSLTIISCSRTIILCSAQVFCVPITIILCSSQ